MITDTKQLRELAQAALKPMSSFERPHLFRLALEEFEKSATPNAVLELLDTIDAHRKLLDDAALLCRWIAETPSQRGSINGKAAQIEHAITEHLKGTP